MRSPEVGEVVHYVMPDGASHGEDRPAIVVRVWSPHHPTVQLQVFTDGGNDGPEYASGVTWKTSVRYAGNREPGTWHRANEVHG